MRDLKDQQNDDDDDSDKEELDKELEHLEHADKFGAVLNYGKFFKGLEHKGFSKFDRRAKKSGIKDRRKTDLNLLMIKGKQMGNRKGGRGKKSKNPFSRGLGGLIKKNAKKPTGSKSPIFDIF